MKYRRFTILSLLVVIAVLFTAVTPALAAPKDPVRVWVSYQRGHSAEVAASLQKANASFHYDFPELDAYVVTLPSAALSGILNSPFVLGVEADPERKPIEPMPGSLEAAFQDSVVYESEVVPWGIDAVQARNIWDVDGNGVVDSGATDGSGIKVCIIDTGYYGAHVDLPDNVTGMSQVDNDWTVDGVGHGSHVAGTINAINNGLGVVGVNPGAVEFHIVKIFANDGAWTASSDLTAAIYNCRDNGANVISMSLGGSRSNRLEQRAFDTLYSAGILHIAAAGNEQEETPGLISYPASYSSVISVAAVDSELAIASFSNQNAYVELAAPGVDVLSTIPYIETNTLVVDGQSFSAYHIEFSGYGSASGALVDGGRCTSTGSWGGKVVLCERGDVDFAVKVLNVQNSGGVAAIIYNNVPGPFLGTMGESTSSTIGLSISQEDGQYLVANKLGATADVSSAYQAPASGYEAWNGTSMATPHVSGVAALIWSANPTWTNVQIREAMNATAFDLGSAGKDVVFGNGLVQAAAALTYLSGGTPPPPPPPTGELTVQITSPAEGSVYKDKATVSIKVQVSADDAPVGGASVTVTVTGTLGAPKVLTGTTGTDGVASFSYRVSTRKTGTGVYTILAEAVKDGYDPVSVSSTFTVN